METDLRKKAENDFEKLFFKLMNKSVFGKLWKLSVNMDILNLPQEEKKELPSRRTKLLGCKVFHRIFVTIKMKKIEILMTNQSI